MKKTFKTFTIIFLCTVLLGSVFFPYANDYSVYAAETRSFPDVAVNYWGLSYIKFASEAGIIGGYPQTDGTFRFKPENSVSREEAMKMLYETVKNSGIGSKDEGTLSTEYTALLTSEGIATWAWECVSYGLKYDILAEADLADFRDASGKPGMATREEIARWAAKAISRDLMPAISLDFSDANKISEGNLLYVDLLTRLGVMIGDNSGNFNPTANIKRVEYAVICTRLYALAKAAYDPAQEIRSYQGKITGIDTANKNLHILGSDGTAHNIKIESSAKIFLDGKEASLGALSSGTNVIAAWGPFGQVDITTGVLSGEGEVTEINKKGDGCSEIVIKNTAGASICYFMIDAEASTAGDPEVGDSVRYIVDGVKLIELAVE